MTPEYRLQPAPGTPSAREPTTVARRVRLIAGFPPVNITQIRDTVPSPFLFAGSSLMAGLFLLLDLDGELTFDAERVRACLRALHGVYNWSESDGKYEFFCEFKSGDDFTIAYMLNSDLQFVAIDGVGEASLQVALEIGRNYGAEVHAVDGEFSEFDILLSTVTSVEDFQIKMDREEGVENLLSR
jgi:hypothetical protein